MQYLLQHAVSIAGNTMVNGMQFLSQMIHCEWHAIFIAACSFYRRQKNQV